MAEAALQVHRRRRGRWTGSQDWVDLGGGMVAMPAWHVTRDPRKSDEARIREANPHAATNMDPSWKPKMAPGVTYAMEPQLQRTPDDTVDSITFCYKDDGSMEEPVLVLGVFNKEAMVHGTSSRVHGLAIAAGGHYERMGARPTFCRDAGDVDMVAAAQKELTEEIGVEPQDVVASKYVGFIDDCNGDPRKHVIRHIFLRHINVHPRESEELQALVCVPLSQLDALIDGDLQVTVEGTPLGFVLNHGQVIRTTLRLPGTQEFIDAIMRGGGPA